MAASIAKEGETRYDAKEFSVSVPRVLKGASFWFER